MRCHFNFRTGDSILLDEIGVEVASVHDARREALQAIHEVSQGDDAAEFDWSAWTLSVTDSDGQVLLTLPLQQLIGEVTLLH
ncbi:DUF6894 family protein [Microvirga subterranea]|uniref:DUF6894 domain-containing protein n=1 Tax=Microvirga subterranea TaxID=186651 RepID=A0A370HRH1_9HYPH|nr:hypothetical protein [Microvirga subterranea]RDI59514.1 hypothetical protein DES45_104430 [Microvirga subterranea]